MLIDKIIHWSKHRAPSIELPTGQRMQIHFYQNQVTGDINYTHLDFKVKGIVSQFYTPQPLGANSQYVPLIPQNILDNYRLRF